MEGAITRLAGAAELGTEPLIYLRRKDVAEVVDAFVNQARNPGGLGMPLSALTRLAIVRRSASRDGRERRTACSPEFRVIGGRRTPAVDRGTASPAPRGKNGGRSSSASPSVRGAGEARRRLFNEKAASPTAMRSNGSARPPWRARSPVNTARMGDRMASRRLRGGRDDEKHKWRQLVRSPLPEAFSSPRTPVALAADSLTSTAGCTPSTTSLVEGTTGSSCATAEKITCVPVSPRPTGTGAAFEDFWSSGWG